MLIKIFISTAGKPQDKIKMLKNVCFKLKSYIDAKNYIVDYYFYKDDDLGTWHERRDSDHIIASKRANFLIIVPSFKWYESKNCTDELENFLNFKNLPASFYPIFITPECKQTWNENHKKYIGDWGQIISPKVDNNLIEDSWQDIETVNQKLEFAAMYSELKEGVVVLLNKIKEDWETKTFIACTSSFKLNDDRDKRYMKYLETKFNGNDNLFISPDVISSYFMNDNCNWFDSKDKVISTIHKEASMGCIDMVLLHYNEEGKPFNKVEQDKNPTTRTHSKKAFKLMLRKKESGDNAYKEFKHFITKKNCNLLVVNELDYSIKDEYKVALRHFLSFKKELIEIIYKEVDKSNQFKYIFLTRYEKKALNEFLLNTSNCDQKFQDIEYLIAIRKMLSENIPYFSDVSDYNKVKNVIQEQISTLKINFEEDDSNEYTLFLRNNFNAQNSNLSINHIVTMMQNDYSDLEEVCDILSSLSNKFILNKLKITISKIDAKRNHIDNQFLETENKSLIHEILILHDYYHKYYEKN